jgi:hypothetical protein
VQWWSGDGYKTLSTTIWSTASHHIHEAAPKAVGNSTFLFDFHLLSVVAIEDEAAMGSKVTINSETEKI